ncbi:hypothetical protein Peur_046566 [Populus x canadensis]
MWGSMYKKGKCITRRFVFDPSAIADLKAQVTSSEMTPPLSENSMGNLFWIAATRYVAESKPGLNDFFFFIYLVTEVRNEFQKSMMILLTN